MGSGRAKILDQADPDYPEIRRDGAKLTKRYFRRTFRTPADRTCSVRVWRPFRFPQCRPYTNKSKTVIIRCIMRTHNKLNKHKYLNGLRVTGKWKLGRRIELRLFFASNTRARCNRGRIFNDLGQSFLSRRRFRPKFVRLANIDRYFYT